MIMEAEAANLVGYENFRYNLSESSVRDRGLRELGIDFGDMNLPYGHHFGRPDLRALIAGFSGESISADDVLVTAGAAGALFIISTCLLDPGAHMVVGFPNYATNYETPYAIGARVENHTQTFERGFSIDLDTIESQITDETCFLSLTCPHNPTGVMFSRQDLDRLIEIVERKGCWLILDETYREMAYDQMLPVAYQTLAKRDELLLQIRKEIKEGFEITKNWVRREKRLEWIEPDAGVTCWVRMAAASENEMKNFYDVLKTKYKTLVGPGYRFKMPYNCMRIGFGWTGPFDTRKGLESISNAIRDCFAD